MSWARRSVTAAAVLAMALGLGWALWPKPMQVDIAPAQRGPMEETLVVDGVTRVRNPYTVSAPIAGTITRSPVEVGDQVTQGETIVAVIRPLAPSLMDSRSRAEAEAVVAEASAAVALSEARLVSATTARDHAESELARGRVLANAGTIPQRMLDDLQETATQASQAVTAAQAELDLNLARLNRAGTMLIGPGETLGPEAGAEECCVQILAPATGSVLELTDRNARQVTPGSPLLRIGDLGDLEIEVHVLSVDAVRIHIGAPALIERWGGEAALPARVRSIEPSAFTRVSALGIEEQRVRLHLELLAPREDRVALGDGFRVQARLVLWQEDSLLQIPQAALFRSAGGWAVFRMVEGQARLTPVVPGRMTPESVEVLDGLAEGDLVILYPSRELTDGSAVLPRDGGP